jgi:hypothetical protein
MPECVPLVTSDIGAKTTPEQTKDPIEIPNEQRNKMSEPGDILEHFIRRHEDGEENLPDDSEERVLAALETLSRNISGAGTDAKRLELESELAGNWADLLWSYRYDVIGLELHRHISSTAHFTAAIAGGGCGAGEIRFFKRAHQIVSPHFHPLAWAYADFLRFTTVSLHPPLSPKGVLLAHFAEVPETADLAGRLRRDEISPMKFRNLLEAMTGCALK